MAAEVCTVGILPSWTAGAKFVDAVIGVVQPSRPLSTLSATVDVADRRRHLHGSPAVCAGDWRMDPSCGGIEKPVRPVTILEASDDVGRAVARIGKEEDEVKGWLGERGDR